MAVIQELDPPTLPGRLGYYAETRPERVALRVKRMGIWQPYTWREYRDEVAACGLMLQELGVANTDHVAILSDNRPEWLFADLGGQLIGARSVGIYQTNPPEDVAYVVSHSQSKVVFAEDQEQVDKLIEVADQTPSVTHIVVFEPRGTRDYEDPRLMTWDDFRAQGTALLAKSPHFFADSTAALDPEAPTMVVYTSGTTGQPKGALISSRNALTQSVRILQVMPVQECDQVLSYLPLCHVAEKIFSVFLPLSSGAVVHFGESIETVRADLREVSPTVFLGVPRIWEKMHASVSLKMKDASWLKRVLYEWASAAGKDISERRLAGRPKVLDRLTWWLADFLVFRPLQEKLGMRRCAVPVTGAAPISPDLLSWFHGVGIRILEGFGQTECAGVSHVNPVTQPVLGTVGRVLPGLECVVAEDGELLIRGPNVFCGYLHNDEATAATIDADGWLHTGDIGTIDDDGYTRITGRKKEIIITAGGKNLSPEKIENALKMSPYIKEAVAIGDRRKFISALIQIDGEAVGDWATRRELAFTSFADLTRRPEVDELVKTAINEANDRLARVEHVRAFRLFDKELHQDDGELTATQKVRRRAVAEIYEALIESIYTKGSS